MKKFTTFILLLLLFAPIMQAQQCGMTAQMNEEMLIRTRKNIELLRISPLQQRDVIYLPITFHVVNREDGVDTLKTQEILAQLCQINNIYSPDIQFYIKNIDKIVNSTIYNEHANATSLMRSYIDDASINVWITGDASPGGSVGIVDLVAGYYSPCENWIVMDKDYIDLGETALPHELGHYLGLPHTTGGCAGWELPILSWTDSLQVPDSLTLGCALELQDGSNCATTGDYICDTPPDYGFGFGWPDCDFTINILDQNGEVVHPMEENLMGSFVANNCVADDFTLTPMQIDLIRVFLNTLPPFPIPEETPLSGTPSLLSPTNESITPLYDQIYFEWEAIAGATAYVLEISVAPSFNPALIKLSTEIEGGANNITITSSSLDPDKKYYWRVLPYNSLYTCSTYSDIFNFRTGMVSHTSTIKALDQLKIIPNPVSSNDLITIKATSSNTFQATIQLYNVEGQQIGRSLQYKFSQGQNQIQLPYNHLQSGLYFLKITHNNQQITKKVMMMD